MNSDVIITVLIPFIGTTLGSALVFFLKNSLSSKIEKLLLGFSGGVMIAASIWSLILPAIESSKSIIPIVVGLFLGMIILIVINKYTINTVSNNRFLLIFSITVHNIPEGIAVGVISAGLLTGSVSLPAALAFALGIGIQNIPEGAIISMPLKCCGKSKFKSFIYGALSGIVEPIASIITILLMKQIVPLLPTLLALAAGTMIYVVIKELIPESITSKNDNISTIFFFIGFSIMMILDVLLG